MAQGKSKNRHIDYSKLNNYFYFYTLILLKLKEVEKVFIYHHFTFIIFPEKLKRPVL